MARKDEILHSFLKHEMLKGKYKLKKSDIPSTVREALSSDKPIVKTIAIIVDGLEKPTPDTDVELRKTVIQYLNNTI